MTHAPYYEDDWVTLWHGDMREVVPALAITADCIVTDPPYGETRLTWDRWPDGWPEVAAAATRSMWVFGSMRLFGQTWGAFTGSGWSVSQDFVGYDEEGEPVYKDVTVVWEKHNGSGFAADRFRRVHEHAVHWYRGSWSAIHHEVPILGHTGPNQGTRKASRAGTEHLGQGNGHNRPWLDTGTRLMRSVLPVRSMHGRALHPTEKPVALLDPLVRYACPPGGTVLDPFAGSGSVSEAARLSGRKAILVEADERYCETIARRVSQARFDLPLPPATAEELTS